MYAHPRYGYLIAGALLLFWLFGVICGWKWTYETSTWGQNTFLKLLSEKRWRICVGAILAVALVALLYLFFSAAGNGETPKGVEANNYCSSLVT